MVGARNIFYSWDTSGTGDLERVADGSIVTTLTYEGGHLQTLVRGGVMTTFEFDEAGRRTLETSSVGSIETSWTGEDRLATWERRNAGGSVIESAAYVYDGSGQRLSATVYAPSPYSQTSTQTVYTYGWDGLELRWMRAESQGASATLSYLFDELDRPYAASYEATRAGESTAAVFALMTTDHGDVVGLTDASANQFARYAYGPFGEAEEVASRAAGGVSAALAAEITSLQPLRYAGYDYDAWSNTYYLQARYYDPATKQFLSKDPAEADGEESAYQYCAGDPINQDDPDGEWAQVVAAKIVGGALVGAMEGHAWYGAGAAWKSRPFRRGFVKRFKKNWKWKDSVREARFGAAVGAVVGPGGGSAAKWGGRAGRWGAKVARRTKWGGRALDWASGQSGRVKKFAQRNAGRLAKRFTINAATMKSMKRFRVGMIETNRGRNFGVIYRNKKGKVHGFELHGNHQGHGRHIQKNYYKVKSGSLRSQGIYHRPLSRPWKRIWRR